jgi:hypothetical protein
MELIMELSIIKAIKQTLYKIRRAKPAKHKPMPIVKQKIVKKKEKIVKKKHELIKTVVNGQQLSLSQIARNYGLEIATVRARYRVGNRGKLLIRPSHRQHKST